MKRLVMIAVAAAALVSVSFAQEDPDQSGRGRRGAWGQGGGGPNRGAWMDQMFQRTAEDLELDEEQQAAYDEIVAGFRERMQVMREQFRELRQAEVDGDEARVEEIRASLPERPGPGFNPMQQMIDELRPILREDQVAKLEQLSEQRRQRGPAARMERLAEELELDDEQRTQVDELAQGLGEQFRAMRDQWRELRSVRQELREAEELGDEQRVEELSAQLEEARPNPAAIMDNFYSDVEEVLYDDQIEKLDTIRERNRQMQADFQQRFAAEGGQRGWARGGRAGRGGSSGRGGSRDRGAARGNEPTPANAAPEKGASGDAAGPSLSNIAGADDGVDLPVLDRFEEAVNYGDALELDDDQRKQFDEILDIARSQQQEKGLSDEQIAKDMLKEMRTILREDQIKALGTFQEEVRRGVSSDSTTNDVRLIIRAARKLRLSRTQTVELKAIETKARKQHREIRRDRGKLAELGNDTKAEIIAILDADQARRFQEELKELDGKQRRSNRR